MRHSLINNRSCRQIKKNRMKIMFDLSLTLDDLEQMKHLNKSSVFDVWDP